MAQGSSLSHQRELPRLRELPSPGKGKQNEWSVSPTSQCSEQSYLLWSQPSQIPVKQEINIGANSISHVAEVTIVPNNLYWRGSQQPLPLEELNSPCGHLEHPQLSSLRTSSETWLTHRGSPWFSSLRKPTANTATMDPLQILLWGFSPQAFLFADTSYLRPSPLCTAVCGPGTSPDSYHWPAPMCVSAASPWSYIHASHWLWLLSPASNSVCTLEARTYSHPGACRQPGPCSCLGSQASPDSYHWASLMCMLAANPSSHTPACCLT